MPLITAPAVEPVTLLEAKLHLRVDHADDDTLITSLIKTARQQAEHRTGRRYGVQTWERAYDAFPAWALLLPDPPVTAIVSIKYDDANAVEQTLDPAAYRLRPHSEPAAVMPVSAWPVALVKRSRLTVYPVSLPSAEARVRVTLPPSGLNTAVVMLSVPAPSCVTA